MLVYTMCLSDDMMSEWHDKMMKSGFEFELFYLFEFELFD